MSWSGQADDLENDSNSSTNVSLLIRVKDPENHDAWARFDAKYRPMIVRFCQARMGMTPEAAEEAAQTVLVKLVKNMKAFEYNPQHSFRAWLNRVTKNSVIDAIRRTRPDQAVGGTDVLERLNNISDEEHQTDLADRLSLELRQALFSECESLVQSRVNEQTWVAFCRLRDGEKAGEVSDSLGMTIAAVYRAKTRVLKLFREEVTMRLQARD